ncbi:hypothetical protein [Loigolactobacillus binensis]|uniref:Uncharacterized protein n=1 Tax=Loigolactobacillus binensis TaxID=2559922 RepID=A0ABW3EH36_9LACO|nr:hypothetical protein [Loigolactobacillus binensis]
MNYQINFTNKVKADSVTVACAASYTTLQGKRRMLYTGEAIFQRAAVAPLFLQTGEVALRAMEQIMVGLQQDYQLVKVNFAQPQNTNLLGVPTLQAFGHYLTEHKLLHCVPTHQVNGETVVDTKFIQELRIG